VLVVAACGVVERPVFVAVDRAVEGRAVLVLVDCVGVGVGAGRAVLVLVDRVGVGAGRASGVACVCAVSDALCVRAAALAVVDVARRWVAGFSSAACVLGVALSVFARAVVRLRVFVGLTCSFASGVSDVLLMKKTPFYITIRPLGGGNLSSQP